jgi:hypothetical protein
MAQICQMLMLACKHKIKSLGCTLELIFRKLHLGYTRETLCVGG